MKPTIQIDIINPTRAHRIAAVLAVLAVFAFVGAPICKAVTPAPDGGYANGNTAEGTSALFTLSPAGGSNNTALGFQALYADSGGSSNTAVGWNALRFNGITDGNDNTAIGAQALYKNTSGNGNTAVGRNALLLNTRGIGSTAVGFQALELNAEDSNTAVGYQAAVNNTTGTVCAFGASALLNNTTGTGNTAIGGYALYRNTVGAGNTAVGEDVLGANTIGSNNTALGHDALLISTGQGNTAIGSAAGATLAAGDGNVYIGESVTPPLGSESNTTRIRNIYSSVATTRAVYVDGDNKIGTLSSSRRYKDEIKPIDAASETLFALRPVSFRYKKEVDRSRALSFGLIAEEVAEVNPDLITRDKEGQPQTVRYEAVNAMLLNEFLKEHRKVGQQRREMQEQKAVIAELRSTIAQHENGMQALVARLQEQEERLVKVSARLELRESTPQLVENVGNP